MQPLRYLACFARGSLGIRSRSERCIERGPLVAATCLRRIEQRLWQTEARGNRKRLRPPWHANFKAIRWCKGGKIKCHRTVHDTWRDMCVLLKFRVVAGGQHATTAKSQLVNDCGGQGSPLRRISPRPRLIKEHDVARNGTEQNALNRGEVTREGAETLRDGLIVANVGPDVPRWGHRRPKPARNR